MRITDCGVRKATTLCMGYKVVAVRSDAVRRFGFDAPLDAPGPSPLASIYKRPPVRSDALRRLPLVLLARLPSKRNALTGALRTCHRLW